MRKYWVETDKMYGLPDCMTREHDRDFLFLTEQEGRAEAILKALEGLRVSTALALLKQCETAVLQSPFSMY